MTGSSTLGLLDTAADLLAGRINIASLRTACWGEDLGDPTHSILYDHATPLQIQEANRILQGAITYGQFPEVLIQEKDNDRANPSKIFGEIYIFIVHWLYNFYFWYGFYFSGAERRG